MKTFITWSGAVSHGVALELKEFLRLIFPTVDAFVSSDDIRKGSQWRPAITEALSQSQRGILCLTSDNFNQPWVLFEAGVLTKALEKPVLYTVLLGDLDPSALEGNPLSQFQHTRIDKTDMLRLLCDINKDVTEGRRLQGDLTNLFETLWPHFEQSVSRITQKAAKREMWIAELARESPIIAGRVFRNAVIRGPAVLAILEGNRFSRCLFDNPLKPEAMLWTPMNPDAAIGAIGLSRCQFESCDFVGIGFTGPPEVLEAIRRDIPMAKPSPDDAT
jgi:hypothetical protein